jgi:hypothetical protein
LIAVLLLVDIEAGKLEEFSAIADDEWRHAVIDLLTVAQILEDRGKCTHTFLKSAALPTELAFFPLGFQGTTALKTQDQPAHVYPLHGCMMLSRNAIMAEMPSPQFLRVSHQTY